MCQLSDRLLVSKKGQKGRLKTLFTLHQLLSPFRFTHWVILPASMIATLSSG
jgi:hypothetical protein